MSASVVGPTDGSNQDTRSSTDKDSDDDDDNLLRHDPTPSNVYPFPKWFTVKQLQHREYGRLLNPGNPRRNRLSCRNFDPYWFRSHAYSSIFFFQRFELCERLEEHNGCVNCLNFNSSGDLLCSGSDDLQVSIWDWQRSQLRHKYHSGHSSNVFQSKFCVDGSHIVTCARDGQVRICDVRNTTSAPSKKVAQHKAPAHKLSLTAPQVILSCGEDGLVIETDLRLPRPLKLMFAEDGGKRIPLYSINCDPFDSNHFIVSGRNPQVLVYDRRFLLDAKEPPPSPVAKLCPDHLKTSRHSVTCAMYNSTGQSVLASYNDEDMYTFDVKSGKQDHCFKGHRNSATVKGCSWFTDDFVLSGSDDGYIYGWDKESEHIVMSLYADENGVVNCMAPHPTSPFLATSGLDDNVKIWQPSSQQWPVTLKGIKQRICSNVRDRKIEQRRSNADHGEDLDEVDASMIWLIIRQLRARQRGPRPESSSDSDEEGNSGSGGGRDAGDSSQQCVPS